MYFYDVEPYTAILHLHGVIVYGHGNPLIIMLMRFTTVSSTFQLSYFDEAVLQTFISYCYKHGIRSYQRNVHSLLKELRHGQPILKNCQVFSSLSILIRLNLRQLKPSLVIFAFLLLLFFLQYTTIIL
jgi:hypothetical protein